jgi:hypothetical protein
MPFLATPVKENITLNKSVRVIMPTSSPFSVTGMRMLCFFLKCSTYFTDRLIKGFNKEILERMDFSVERPKDVLDSRFIKYYKSTILKKTGYIGSHNSIHETIRYDSF